VDRLTLRRRAISRIATPDSSSLHTSSRSTILGLPMRFSRLGVLVLVVLEAELVEGGDHLGTGHAKVSGDYNPLAPRSYLEVMLRTRTVLPAALLLTGTVIGPTLSSFQGRRQAGARLANLPALSRSRHHRIARKG
jgi:hypothetical protein